MSGSTVETMATAIDAARVLVYCISEDYKISQNCRMEAVRVPALLYSVVLPFDP